MLWDVYTEPTKSRESINPMKKRYSLIYRAHTIEEFHTDKKYYIGGPHQQTFDNIEDLLVVLRHKLEAYQPSELYERDDYIVECMRIGE